MHVCPAMGPPVGITLASVNGVRQRLVRTRLVQPAGLWNSQTPRRFVAFEDVQQRNLHGQRQRLRQTDQRRRAPEDQAAGKRQQMRQSRTARYARPNRGRQVLERPKGQQVLDPSDRFAAPPQIRRGPTRQGLFPSPLRAGLLLGGQDPKSHAAQIAQSLGRLAIGLTQQAADEVQRVVGRPLAPRGRVEAAPEGPLRPLFAAPEERPANPALVILGARQGQRQQDDVAFVVEAARVRAQFRRPVRVASQFRLGHAVRRPPAAQVFQGADDGLREMGQTGSQFDLFFMFRDLPAEWIVIRKRR